MGTLLTALWMSNLNTIVLPLSGFAKIAILPVGGLYISFFYGAAVALAFAYVLGFTPLGRHTTGITGLEQLGLQTWVSNVFYGGVLVVAVTIATLLRRRTT
jgi:ribose/xylose/arabinose/galactoside ABC-type transport system permease subunit